MTDNNTNESVSGLESRWALWEQNSKMDPKSAVPHIHTLYKPLPLRVGRNPEYEGISLPYYVLSHGNGISLMLTSYSSAD